ncbi:MULTISPECIES: N-acetylmuramoyl-L-alanine amidase [unclassified Streptomyces]|uniref:N-acetylmuramoyl-L-alanine amidase n=1 Tax=unclassified Streptomyces TaxID=2593676 RepID=UPI00035E4E2F|nr:N-acetylmuramoyl-L-alanine amidase [Streptomyces sp. BoleA5]
MFKSKARTTVVVVAALVPACAAAWLVWDATSGPDDPGRNGDLPQNVRPHRSAAASSGPSPAAPSSGAAKPLAGKVVVLDPGHNARNSRHTAEINRLVDIGTARKECDTTGTATDAGYAEAAFTLDVSRRARALLEARGAAVRFTYDGDRAYGPCIDERARIGNKAKADAVVSVHGDGSAAGNRGFHVILPAPVHRGIADTRAISGPSKLLGTALKRHFAAETGTRPSNYIGGGTGLDVRRDLGGLNLSTRPKVLIECGNMRDPKDAALMTSPAWRQRAAEGIADGISAFLEDRE